jgi:hypothetical protein
LGDRRNGPGLSALSNVYVHCGDVFHRAPDWLSYLPAEMPSPEEIGFDFLEAIAVTLAALTYVGTLAFSFGVALLGWIRSRLAGLISTISALLFVLMLNIVVVAAGLLVLSARP